MRIFDKFRRGKSTRLLRVAVTLAPGERVSFGGVTIAPGAGGHAVVIEFDGQAVVARRLAGGRLQVVCYTDGRVLPERVAETPNEAYRVPLCRFGPGGEFTRDYTPGEDAESQIPMGPLVSDLKSQSNPDARSIAAS